MKIYTLYINHVDIGTRVIANAIKHNEEFAALLEVKQKHDTLISWLSSRLETRKCQATEDWIPSVLLQHREFLDISCC